MMPFAPSMCPSSPKKFVPGPFEYHEELELRILSLTNLGLGIGRVNNWVVMVPFVCIGELAKVRIFRNHKNYSEADLLEILEASSARVRPACPLFGKCGGCQYQHMDYAEQLNMKCMHVRETMLRLGGIDMCPSACIPSTEVYGYRSKITPHFQRPKSMEKFPIGFLGVDRSSGLIDVEQCPIATEKINAELGLIREQTRASAETFKRGGTLLIRETGEGVTTDSGATVTESIGGFTFQFKAGAFFQNNPRTLPKIVNFIALSSGGCGYLIDAYCGVGVFGICLAENFHSVLGIEIDSEAISFARTNAATNGISNISFIAGDAAKIFDQISFNGEDTCLLIDPPRRGCDRDFIGQILKISPRRIIYVSCAPDTQARDLELLSAKYVARELQPVDMFPQTRHIENIAVLESRNF
jgi:23S rRNA (uracil1939-C5)-methyltransferase/tRNA (uracil-5-)-methyltransferase